MGKKRVTKTEPRQRVGQNLNVWLPDALMDAFERQLGRSRRTRTAEVEVMMEQYLTQLGLWKPTPDAD